MMVSRERIDTQQKNIHMVNVPEGKLEKKNSTVKQYYSKLCKFHFLQRLCSKDECFQTYGLKDKCEPIII